MKLSLRHPPRLIAHLLYSPRQRKANRSHTSPHAPPSPSIAPERYHHTMCTLNVHAPTFFPSHLQQVAQPIFNLGEKSCVRILTLNADEYREFLLNTFNREEVADEDL